MQPAAASDLERLARIHDLYPVHRHRELDGHVARRHERRDESRLRCPLEDVEQRAHVVAVRVRDPDPLQVSRVDRLDQRSLERLTLHRTPCVHQPRLVRMNHESVYRQGPDLRDLHRVANDVHISDALDAHMTTPGVGVCFAGTGVATGVAPIRAVGNMTGLSASEGLAT